MGGTISVQTQCCLTKKADEEWEEDDGESLAAEGATQLVVEPVHWNERPLASPKPANVPMSLNEATTIIPRSK